MSVASRRFAWVEVILALASTPAMSRADAQVDPGQGDDSTDSTFTIGHQIFQLDVIGTHGEDRPIAVDVWYPSHQREGDPTSYTSALYGVPLVPALWDPLAWRIPAESAMEGLRIAAPTGDGGRGFPVIVFSHGSTDLPLDYYVTLERLAARGFVVAAPAHLNNTADDVKIDWVNKQAGQLVLNCRDGLPPPCSRSSVPDSMADRALDIGAVIDALPRWFGSRVDTSRVGLMGHSRGSVTALLEAGGSDKWGIGPDTRHEIKGVMGLSAGVAPITLSVDLGNITVPTVLVDGTLSQYLPVVQAAFGQIASQQKLLVVVKGAVHRTFNSGICRMTQAAGAMAELKGSRALLDRQTVEEALTSGNGTPLDFCPYSDFAVPVDITPITREITGVQVTPTNVPSTGLSSIAEVPEIVDLAAVFFGNVLSASRREDADIREGMKPEWLVQPDPSDLPDPSTSGAQTDPCLTLRLINPHDTDPAIGPGALASHYTWINRCVQTNHQLLVFLPATNLTPAAYQHVQQLAATIGYHVIGLMYPNNTLLASACANPDQSVANACFENARLQILDGVNRNTVVDVNKANSIDNRLTKLLQYLATSYPGEGWSHFLSGGAPKWSRIAVSGHSQGGGEAAMIAKLRVTARVVLFSAVPDSLVAGGAVPPSWEDEHVTPSDRYWGLAHDRDATYYAAIAAGWIRLGMTEFGPLVPPEGNDPPYGFTHTLVTDLVPQSGGYSRAHGSTAVDAFTPLGPDGAPLLADAWRYLLTARTPEDETSDVEDDDVER